MRSPAFPFRQEPKPHTWVTQGEQISNFSVAPAKVVGYPNPPTKNLLLSALHH
jgi:hypothetical protein